MDLLRVYRLYRKMHQYPTLIGLMRSIFLDVLDQRGVVRRERLYTQALEEMRKDAVPDTETNRQEYLEALIDTYVAQHLSGTDVENYINLARKRDNAQTLSMLVNRDQATAEEIVKALREFCDIPKGEVYISGEEAEGIRVALISRFISNQLPFISLANAVSPLCPKGEWPRSWARAMVSHRSSLSRSARDMFREMAATSMVCVSRVRR